MSEVDKMMADNRPMDEIAYEAMTSEVQPSGKTYPVYKTEDGRLELEEWMLRDRVPTNEDIEIAANMRCICK